MLIVFFNKVLLLVDEFEYNQNSHVVLFVPTTHVLIHHADMLSVQLLHDSGMDPEDRQDMVEKCWHSSNTSSIIYVQNVTFAKHPGKNIRGTS